MSYRDSSALAKLYLQEPDSTRFRALAMADGVVTTGSLAWFERRTVFGRREAEGVLPIGEAAVLASELKADMAAGDLVVIVPQGTDLEREFDAALDAGFAQEPAISIRTKDALHLALGKLAGENNSTTADVRQSAAARLLGFAVLP